MQGKKYIPTEAELKLIETLAEKGYTDTEIAKKLKIGRTTFYSHLEHFEHLIKKGREVKDETDLKDVKSALVMRAKGFTQKVNDRDVYFPPDPTSMIFYIVNKSNGEFVSINREPKKEIDLEVIQTIKELLTTPV
jgi:DNA-binding CsgD family transcriptional regulator